jgi:hypothetical protein
VGLARSAVLIGFFLVLVTPELKAALAAPSLTARGISTSQISLTWTDPNKQGNGFQIERSLSSTSGFALIATAGKNVTTYTNSGLAAGTTYYYRVRALANNGSTSPYSNVAGAATQTQTVIGTAPAAPSNLTAAAASSSQINLSWSDNSNNETAFLVERASSSAGPWTQIGSTGASGYGDSGLPASTTFYYRVRAYNSYGYSAYTNTAFATTLAGTSLPAAPSSLSATAVSTSQINLVWVDLSGNESGFKIERGTATSSWSQIATVGTNVTSYASTGLTASTTYSYRVRAYNTAGDSAYSNTASATTSGATGSTWSRRFGNSGDDRTQAVAVDGVGNVAATGHFMGTTDFGGGSVSSYVHPNLGPTTDVFVASYSPSGGFRWERTIGADASEEGLGVATDTAGNVVVTGYQGSYSVDYGGGPQTVLSYNDIFIAKYSAAGAWVWSKTIGGYGYDQGNAIATDIGGNVWVTGYIGKGTIGDVGVNFGGGALYSAGGYDVFLVKYSATGQHVWSKRFGSTGTDVGMAVAADGSGNVIVAGTFEGSVDFGGGALTSAGMRDIFVAKYSGTGQYLWSKRFGSSGDDVVNGVAVDSLGDVALSGKFQGSVGFGGTALTSAGGDDAFLVKLSGSAGSQLWAKRFGSTSQDIATGVAVDGSGNVVVSGYYSGAVDFGGGALTSVGIDVFVAKYNSAGTHLWSKRFGGMDTQISDGVAMASTGAVTVGGFFNVGIDFGTGNLTSAGAFDAFLASIGP